MKLEDIYINEHYYIVWEGPQFYYRYPATDVWLPDGKSTYGDHAERINLETFPLDKVHTTWLHAKALITIAELKEKEEEFGWQIDDLNNEISMLESENDYCEEQRRVTVEELDETREELETLKDAGVDDLKGQLSDANDEIDMLTMEISQLNSDIDDLQARDL